MEQVKITFGKTSQSTEIEDTLLILNKGESKIKLEDNYKNLILVLGNTGSGKSTFIQWIAGDDSKLFSTKVKSYVDFNDASGGENYEDNYNNGSDQIDPDDADYIIEDGNRIGSSIISKTIFPELVIDNATDSAYYDCPGFSDTRSISFDIASSYFIKKLTDHAENLKLIFTINYSSVTQGGDRLDFIRLLRHLSEFVLKIDKFKKSIAMVVTKVDKKDTRKQIIGRIVEYLHECIKDIQKYSSYHRTDASDRKFHKSALEFINVLLMKQGKNFARIGIFRKPSKPGPLSDNEDMQRAKKIIKKVMIENLVFSAKSNDDFGYTITDQSRNIITSLVEKIYDNVHSNVGLIATKIKNYHNELYYKIMDIMKLLIDKKEINTFSRLYIRLLAMKFQDTHYLVLNFIKEVENVTTLEDFAVCLKNFANLMSVDFLNTDMKTISNEGNFLIFFQNVYGRPFVFSFSAFDLLKSLQGYFFRANIDFKKSFQDTEKSLTYQFGDTLKTALDRITMIFLERIEALEIENLLVELDLAYQTFSNLRLELLTSNIFDLDLSEKVKEITSVLRISNFKIKDTVKCIEMNRKYFEILKIINASSSSINSRSLESLDKTVSSFSKLIKWYKTLKQLYDNFFVFEVQKNYTRMRYLNVKTDEQMFVKSYVDLYFVQRNIEDSKFIEIQSKHLSQMLSATFESNLKPQCSDHSELVFKGESIKMSDFTNRDGSLLDVSEICLRKKFVSLHIFALNVFFVDKDFEMTGSKINFVVIAPKWEIIGLRKINLDGLAGSNHDPLRANTGKYPGSKGDDGKPGLPGGPAGNFYGIAGEILDLKHLTIKVNGGRGGNGQDGGHGAEGKRGEDGKAEKGETYCYEENSSQFTELIVCYGSRGGKGGSGGNGGKRGFGGQSGTVFLINLKNSSDLPVIENESLFGLGGKKGLGGKGGLTGNQKRLRAQSFNTFNLYLKPQIINSTERQSDGSNGTDGTSAVGLKNPEQIRKLKFSHVLSMYKMYLQEHMVNCFKRQLLMDFHVKLDTNMNIENFYDLSALIDEFKYFDRHSTLLFEDKNSILIDLYQNFQQRFLIHAKRYKINKNFDQIKQILIYLHAAASSKIINLKENIKPLLITDIAEYIKHLSSDINVLRNLQQKTNKEISVDYNNNMFKISLKEKITEAYNFIENQVIPKLNQLLEKNYYTIEFLIDEVVGLKQQILDEKRKLFIKKKEIEKVLFVSRVLSCVKISMQILGCFSGTGLVISSLTNTLIQATESIISNDNDSKINISSLPKGLLSNITDIRNKLETRVSSNAVKIKDAKTLSKTVSLIKNLDTGSQIALFGFNLINKFANDDEKIKAMDEVIRQVNIKSLKLEEYESQIFSHMVPMLKNMEESLINVSSQLREKSQVYLDVSRWKIQSALKDMKFQFGKLIKGFRMEEDFTQSIENIEESFIFLIDIYDRIQIYQEKQEMTDYISNVVLSDVSNNNINDITLRRSFSYAEEVIRSNLIIDRYKSAISALKQHVFPLAYYYLNELTLPSVLQMEDNFQSLLNKVVAQVEKVNIKLIEYETSIQHHDGFVMNACFKKHYISSKPFAVWKNNNYKDEISKLLAGEKVALKSDICSSDSEKEAIKFNTIGLNFNSLNETLSFELNSLLKGFIINATHLGNSYYKFKNDIFLISTKSQNIVFSLENNQNGKPVLINNIYSKIESGNLMLSPYAMWEFQLINSAKLIKFNELSKYVDSLDIELEGCGSFITKEADIGMTYMDQYYESEYFETFSTYCDDQSIFLSDIESSNQYSDRHRREILTTNQATSKATRIGSWINFVRGKINTIFGFVGSPSIDLPSFYQNKHCLLSDSSHNFQTLVKYNDIHFNGFLLLANLFTRKFTRKHLQNKPFSVMNKFVESEKNLQAGIKMWSNLSSQFDNNIED